ncbi:MAG TPA: hypothetical protein PLZ25_13670, partial [Flavobacteriales bacterium]|nr:hypothetical protein [Flavobacteriales bacterium]
MADFTTDGTTRGYTFVGNHQARGSVYKLDMQGDPVASWDQPVDLGVLRGFDLHLVATPTSDGHVAFASTKWSPGYDAQNPFGWEDLPSTVQEYLDVDPQGMHFDANGPNPALGGWFNWEHFRWVSDPDDPMVPPVLQIDMNSVEHAYGYWNTDSYVAKVDGATGDLLWEKQWDEGTGALATGWPGNFRRRQCMFDITEAPDGGLVVCGNTGHNFDDAYIAKLKEPCGFEVSAQLSYACPDDPEHPVNAISLTVNGAGNHAFSWSNGATTPAITDLLPGTYFVLVTDDDGCTTTEGYTIYEPLALGYVAHPACMDPGGDALLEVVAIGGSGDANMSYTWWDSYTIGGYIVGDGHTWNLSNPPHLPYPPYIYVATSLVAQDMITGCTITEVVDVFTGPAPPQAVTSVHIEPADCHAGAFGSIALQLDPDFAPYHVEWSNGVVTQNVFELEGGSYSVTITYGHACTNTYTYTVPDNNTCCTADIVIPDGAYSSDYASPLNTIFSNTSLQITGTFLVDNNCFVNFSTIYMDPGAEIIVEPGAMFVLRDSEVENCTDMMWKSVTARSGAYLEMQRNTVKDAEYAVTALDGATVLLFNNDITDNRVGLYVPNTAGVAFNSVSAHVIGNRFKSTGTLALPYPGQTNAIGNVGFAAVLAYNTAMDLTGYSGWNNLVDGMSNGIIGHNSDLSVAQFNFKNIQPDAAYIMMPVDANGSGIVAIGGSSDQNLKQVGNGKEAQPSFQNCKWGIYTRAMNTSSRDNNMQAMGTGYRVDRARASTSITNNRVVAKRDGMVFNQNAGTANFWVKDNDITFGSPSFSMPISQYSGIVVADAHEGGADSRIEDNKIFHTANTNAHAGISLLAAKQWTVAGNQITMAHNALNRYGIANYGSSRLEVSCNTVTGAGTDYVQGQAAIYSNMGDRLNFTCNDVDLTTNGFLFNGAAQYVNLAGTSFRRHKWALHLSTNAIIGAQERRGNLWYNAPAAGGWGALYEVTGPSDPNPALNPFTYNPAIISGGNTEPPSWSPSEWFQPDYSGANFNCQSGFADGYCGPGIIKEPYPPVVKRTGLDSLVAADGLQNDPYTEESKWMLKGGLYGKLDDDPELRYEYQDMADFWDGLQGSATATFKMVEDGRATLYDLDSTVAAQIVANRDQIEALLDSSKVRMGQLQDSTLAPAQRTAALAALAGFREGIRTLNAWNEVAMETARTTKVLTAEGIQTANAAIGTSRLIEENTKQVNDIWLATVAKEVDTLSTAQAATLLAIADQCPMLGGNAVYAARALYRQVNDTLAWDDQLLCLPHGIIVKSVQQEDVATLTIVPNPARDNATLVLDRPLEQPGMLKVLDMTGKEVLRLDIPEGELRTEFAIGALASGLYQYRVVSG